MEIAMIATPPTVTAPSQPRQHHRSSSSVSPSSAWAPHTALSLVAASDDELASDCGSDTVSFSSETFGGTDSFVWVDTADPVSHSDLFAAVDQSLPNEFDNDEQDNMSTVSNDDLSLSSASELLLDPVASTFIGGTAAEHRRPRLRFYEFPSVPVPTIEVHAKDLTLAIDTAQIQHLSTFFVDPLDGGGPATPPTPGKGQA
jgi:hypothetical protein